MQVLKASPWYLALHIAMDLKRQDMKGGCAPSEYVKWGMRGTSNDASDDICSFLSQRARSLPIRSVRHGLKRIRRICPRILSPSGSWEEALPAPIATLDALTPTGSAR